MKKTLYEENIIEDVEQKNNCFNKNKLFEVSPKDWHTKFNSYFNFAINPYDYENLEDYLRYLRIE